MKKEKLCEGRHGKSDGLGATRQPWERKRDRAPLARKSECVREKSARVLTKGEGTPKGNREEAGESFKKSRKRQRTAHPCTKIVDVRVLPNSRIQGVTNRRKRKRETAH